jgi:hypothetical protein
LILASAQPEPPAKSELQVYLLRDHHKAFPPTDVQLTLTKDGFWRYRQSQWSFLQQ